MAKERGKEAIQRVDKKDLSNRQKGLVAELERALDDWKHARENFQNADKNFIDVATWNLRAAEERYVALYRLAKAKGA